jgi:hypothetical protein
MDSHIDTLLLVALPASGKSELRRYLASLDPEVAADDFALGPTVQLDDYPYVHLMRRISQETRRLEASPVFFASDDEPFMEPREWATLIELINGDYAALGTAPDIPAEPAGWLFDRLTAARAAVGIAPPFGHLSDETLRSMKAALDDEAAALAGERSATLAGYEPGVSTVLIEFARGGPEGLTPPLPDPYGYAYSLRHLSPDILARAAVLYVWVTPQESRRRNVARAVPGIAGDASILHHGIPETVMRGDYGVDDFLWLLERGGGDTIEVDHPEGTFRIPAAVFDNRTDHTSFLRADPSDWDPEQVAELHTALEHAFATLT